MWYSDTLSSLWMLSFNESSEVFIYFSTSTAQGNLSMCQRLCAGTTSKRTVALECPQAVAVEIRTALRHAT